MDILKQIDKHLKSNGLDEAKLPKSVKKFVDYCVEYGASKREVDAIIRKNDLSDAIDEIMELVRDDISPGDFDEIDDLRQNAQYDA